MSLWFPRYLAGGAAAIALTLLAVGTADAQQQSPAQLKAQVNRILRQPQDPSAEERKILDEYFGKSFFKSMTDASPAGLGKLAELRKDLFTQFLNGRGSQAGQDHLLSLTMNTVGTYAIGNMHPAIRYNAALIIGQLSKPGAGAPVPYTPATTALVMILEKDEFRGVPVTSPVKLAALVGLDRHTDLGADPSLAERINAAALAIATKQETPADVSPEVHDWMRRLAVKVLANQQEQGLTAPAYDAAAKLIGSKQVNLDDRCSIAELLKSPMFQGAQGINPETMALAIGRLARDVTAFEAKEAKKYQKEVVGDDSGASFAGGLEGGFRPPRGGGFGGGISPEMIGGLEGGFGGGMPAFDPTANEGPRIEKRRLLDRLKAVADAADQFGRASADETKQRMTDLSQPLRTAFDDAAKNDATEMGIATSMIELAAGIEEMVDQWAPAEPEAAEEEEVVEEDAADEAAPADDADAAPAGAEAAPADAAGN
jgi:hypothetical protein